MKKNREARKQQKAKEQKSPEPEEKETPTKRVTRSAAKEKASLFDEATGAKISKTEQMKRRREERKSREKEKELETQAIFARLQELDDQLPPDIVGMDRNLMREYMRVAHELWKEFSETRAFFPKKVVNWFLFLFLSLSLRWLMTVNNMNVCRFRGTQASMRCELASNKRNLQTIVKRTIWRPVFESASIGMWR